MFRLSRFVILACCLATVIALVACGGGGAKKSTPTATTAKATPTKAATAAPTSASGAAANPFDRYHYTVDLQFTINQSSGTPGTSVSGNVEGDFVKPDSHSFTSTFQFGGVSATQEAVIIGNDAWFRQGGSGAWRATTRSDSDIQDALSLTSADPGFLQDSELSSNLAALNSEDETINGVDTRRYHIPKSAVAALSQLLGEDFLQNAQGLQDFEMTVWLEKETGGLVRGEILATASPGAFGSDLGSLQVPPDATIEVQMTINLTRINDGGVRVQPPM